MNNTICEKAYDILISTQSKDGEFGKNSTEIIHNEDGIRHAINIYENRRIKKPNSSVTLISSLGIKAFKGENCYSVILAKKWFTESGYINNGWFHQQFYVVDADPLGFASPLNTTIVDVRHTSTALLAALCYGGSYSFIVDTLRNIMLDECRDINKKGWIAALGNRNASTDFYTTVYVLSSLYYLKVSNKFMNYGIDKIKLDVLLTDGLNSLCSIAPNKLGYSDYIGQTLRTNGTILFFLAPLISEIYPSFLEASVKFIISNAQSSIDGIFWLDNDYDATINILAGLMMANMYLGHFEIDITPFIDEAKKYVEHKFNSLSSFHPVSLGFLLMIETGNISIYPSNQSLNIDDDHYDAEMNEEYKRGEKTMINKVKQNMSNFYKRNQQELVSKYKDILILPRGRTLQADHLVESISQCEFFIITANSIEHSIVSRMLMIECDQLFRITSDSQLYEFVRINGHYVVHIIPQSISSYAQHGSAEAIRYALSHISPCSHKVLKAIFSIGIAYGISPKATEEEDAQDIGDVIISNRIIRWDAVNKMSDGKMRLNDKEFPFIGDQILAGCQEYLKCHDYPERENIGRFQWFLGTILCGPTVISDSLFKFTILEAARKSLSEDNIVGGEMESSGIWFSSKDNEIPIMIIKGISDWGVNKNGWSFISNEKKEIDLFKDCIQAYACENAYKTFQFIIDQVYGIIE